MGPGAPREPLEASTTVDAVLDGAVVLEQPGPGHGYRVNVDTIHLARFVAPLVPPEGHVIDLGAGVGALALCVAHLARPGWLTLVEANQHACALAERNLARAGWTSRSSVVHGDVAFCEPGQLVRAPDVIVANPPYTPPAGGRVARVEAVRHARQGDVRPFVAAASRMLGQSNGRVAMCYPAHALVGLLDLAAGVRLVVQRVTFVHATRDAPARLVLIEMASNAVARDTTVTAPLIEMAAPGLHEPSRTG